MDGLADAFVLVVVLLAIAVLGRPPRRGGMSPHDTEQSLTKPPPKPSDIGRG